MNCEKLYKEYCCGCGLCEHGVGVEFEVKDGFMFPMHLDDKQIQFCNKVCPVNGHNYNNNADYQLWGENKELYRGWASDEDVRFKAASGGVLTGICMFLLESKKCDAILQVGADFEEPFSVQLYSNTNVDEIKACCGSRYISCLTYKDLEQKIEFGKRYAVIGKPCDIEALSNYMKINEKLKCSIKYRLTFFCAGAPSIDANVKLAEEMKVRREDVVSIRYRGMGWPGKTTIVTKDGENYMEYNKAWNDFLGRKIRKMCKFCVNGTGIYSDISCGDLWELNENNEPSFTEAKGQNIVIARSNTGISILHEAYLAGYIYIEEYDDVEKLRYIQPNHFVMQTTILGKIIGLKLCGKIHPKYCFKKMYRMSNHISIKQNLRTVLGTIKRIKKDVL